MSYVVSLELIVDLPCREEVEKFVMSLTNAECVKNLTEYSCSPLPGNIDFKQHIPGKKFVIFSWSQWLSCGEGNRFWNVQLGWVPLDLASRYSLKDLKSKASKMPCASAGFMIDPVTLAQEAFAIKVKKASRYLGSLESWDNYFCFAENIDDAKGKALIAYPGGDICSFEEMESNKAIAKSDPYLSDDFAANPVKYSLFTNARVNVPDDFDASPFLPGEFVAIKFVRTVKSGASNRDCPLFAVSDSVDGLETTRVRYFANALSCFQL